MPLPGGVPVPVPGLGVERVFEDPECGDGCGAQVVEDVRAALFHGPDRWLVAEPGQQVIARAVGYTSSVSERDYYQAEQAREAAEIDATPEAERQEIRDIYAAKGFAGELLERVTDTITANRDRWLATMMDEELHQQPVRTNDILRSAVVITIATLIGHLIPLLPFVWLPRTTALILAIVLSAGVLFGVGVYSSVTLVGDWRKNGLKMVAIGLSAAAIGFAIGHLFHATGT